MKKTIVVISFLVLFVFNCNARPNPIMVYTPQVDINELYFDSNGKWTMEIRITFAEPMPFSDTAVKSITISSNSGFADVLHFQITSPVTFLVINQDSLSNPLVINPDGDFIEANALVDCWDDEGHYLGLSSYNSTLNFGYLSSIPVVPDGCSISILPSAYVRYLDSSPTIGFENDTIGGLAQIHGRMYDYYGNLFSSGSFKLNWDLNQFIEFDEDSSFYASVLSNNEYYYELYHFLGSTFAHYFRIEPVHVDLLPGETIYQDIHLIDSGLVVSTEPPVQNIMKKIIVAPNPFSAEVQFFVELYSNLQHGELLIFDLSGRKVTQQALPHEKQFKITLAGDKLGIEGTYIYQITENRRSVASGRIFYIL